MYMSKNILLENQKEDIRFKNTDSSIILYNPNTEQYNNLKQIVINSELLNESPTENNLELKYIREIFRELVKDGSFVDELSDEELIKQLTNGNRDIQLLLQSINILIGEVRDDVLYGTTESLKLTNRMLTILNSKDTAQEIEKKINKLFKKNKINCTMDDIKKLQNNPEEVQEFIKKLNKKYSK